MCFQAQILRIFYWHVSLSLDKIWDWNTDIQFIGVYEHIDQSLGKMIIVHGGGSLVSSIFLASDFRMRKVNA